MYELDGLGDLVGPRLSLLWARSTRSSSRVRVPRCCSQTEEPARSQLTSIHQIGLSPLHSPLRTLRPDFCPSDRQYATLVTPLDAPAGLLPPPPSPRLPRPPRPPPEPITPPHQSLAPSPVCNTSEQSPYPPHHDNPTDSRHHPLQPAPPTPTPTPTPPPTKPSSAAERRENPYTIPNAITLARIAATPVIGHFVLQGELGKATALLFVAGFSDLVSRPSAPEVGLGRSCVPWWSACGAPPAAKSKADLDVCRLVYRSMGGWRGNTTWAQSWEVSWTRRRTSS